MRIEVVYVRFLLFVYNTQAASTHTAINRDTEYAHTRYSTRYLNQLLILSRGLLHRQALIYISSTSGRNPCSHVSLPILSRWLWFQRDPLTTTMFIAHTSFTAYYIPERTYFYSSNAARYTRTPLRELLLVPDTVGFNGILRPGLSGVNRQVNTYGILLPVVRRTPPSVAFIYFRTHRLPQQPGL